MLNVGLFVMGPEGVSGFQSQILMPHRLRSAMRSQSEMASASLLRLTFSGWPTDSGCFRTVLGVASFSTRFGCDFAIKAYGPTVRGHPIRRNPIRKSAPREECPRALQTALTSDSGQRVPYFLDGYFIAMAFGAIFSVNIMRYQRLPQLWVRE